jgi:hypothetical protein
MPPRKTFAAMYQSIHFLPAQQSISQTPKHPPNAIIPALQEINQLKSKSARESQPHTSLRWKTRMASGNEEKTRRAKSAKANK